VAALMSEDDEKEEKHFLNEEDVGAMIEDARKVKQTKICRFAFDAKENERNCCVG
jgi:hypothetical protein